MRKASPVLDKLKVIIDSGETCKKRIAELVYDIKPDSSSLYRETSKAKFAKMIHRYNTKYDPISFTKGVLDQ